MCKKEGLSKSVCTKEGRNVRWRKDSRIYHEINFNLTVLTINNKYIFLFSHTLPFYIQLHTPNIPTFIILMYFSKITFSLLTTRIDFFLYTHFFFLSYTHTLLYFQNKFFASNTHTPFFHSPSFPIIFQSKK